MITTCTVCGAMYEASSEEQANEAERRCLFCRKPGKRAFLLECCVKDPHVGHLLRRYRRAYQTVGRAKADAGNEHPGLDWKAMVPVSGKGASRYWVAETIEGEYRVFYMIHEIDLVEV